MRLSLSKSVLPAAIIGIALGVLPAASTAPGGAAAEYSFREPPLNSLGIKSLAELRGKPIVIDFWGKN